MLAILYRPQYVILLMTTYVRHVSHEIFPRLWDSNAQPSGWIKWTKPRKGINNQNAELFWTAFDLYFCFVSFLRNENKSYIFA